MTAMLTVRLVAAMFISCRECHDVLLTVGPGPVVIAADELRLHCPACDDWIAVTRADLQREIDETPSLTEPDRG